MLGSVDPEAATVRMAQVCPLQGGSRVTAPGFERSALMEDGKVYFASVKIKDISADASLRGHVTSRLVEGQHLLQQIWGKDPYDQIRAGEEMGLGSPEYELEEVE